MGAFLNEEEVLKILRNVGAIITNSHIVYTSGKHGSAYINKDAVYPYISSISILCRTIAEHFAGDNIEVVIAPAIGGVILSQWVTYHLENKKDRSEPVLSTYAEKTENNNFVIKRGYDKLIPGKRVLVVEDVLNTGASARKVIEATRKIGGNVVGLGVLCNRGGIVPKEVAYVPKLISLVNLKMDAWGEENCPLCAKKIPINTDIGKGREFLERKQS